MSELLPVYEKSYPIRFFDLGSNARVRTSAVLDFLQDIAGEHALHLGFGVEQLHQRRLTWMLSRYHVQMNDYPGQGDAVQIRTWPSVHKGLLACREFEIRNHNAEVIGAASSGWLLIDLDSKRPVRPAEHLDEVPLTRVRTIIEPLGSLPELTEWDSQAQFRVRRSDLDINQHVNNRVYFDWAHEVIPPSTAEQYFLAAVEINFLGEALAGEQITAKTGVLSTTCEPEYLHRIEDHSSGRELARLKTRWQPFPVQA